MTAENIVISLKKVFAPGMAYVALSRSVSLHGLRILHFSADSIYSSSDITEALENMPPFFQTEDKTSSSSDTFNILLHNTEGLFPHLRDITTVKAFENADIVCLTETWIDK